MTVSHINPPELFTVPGFSQVVVASAGKLAFIAGQGAFDRDFNIIGGNDLYAQTIEAFRNLTHALAAVGATPASVVSTNMYIVGLDEGKTATFVQAMKAALDGKCFPPNASTIVGVTQLGDPRMLVEISAIAAVA